MKRKLFHRLASTLCVLALLLALLPGTARAASSGSCGPNLTWSFSGGTLTIQGTGSMDTDGSGQMPWDDIRSQITTVVIGNGVTTIADGAFESCIYLTSVTIPDSVTTIGASAFSNTRRLQSITLPSGLTSIPYCAFNVSALRSVTIPDGVTRITAYAFAGCEILETVTIPASVTVIGDGAFNGDPLKDVYYSGSESQWKQITISDKNNYNAALLNASIHCSGTAAPAQQTPAPNGGGSGGKSMKKLSKEEITQLLKDNPLTRPGNIYVTPPSTSAPYAPGQVREEYLQEALNRLNAIRRIAGVPAVELDAKLCENAQYGAVLLSAAGIIGHFPSQPSDMPDSFYAIAYEATSGGNLAGGSSLTSAIDAFMDDSDASNIASVGHRHDQIDPDVTRVGFGTARHGSYGQCVVETSSYGNMGSFDYDYLAWPASGNFPNSLFDGSTAWYIYLNTGFGLYAYPEESDTVVTLTRQSDGKSWTFDNSRSYSPGHINTYFKINGGKIIFRPGDVSSYSGVYSVSITGLKTKDGTPTSISYEVDFFNSDTSSQSAPSAPVATSTPSAPSAVLSPQKLEVDGKSVDCEKYNIDGSNYFKLRDLAYVLNGTGSQFAVGFDAATSTVTITTGAAYTSNGTELVTGMDNSKTAQPSRQTILIDGVERGDLTAYNIGGSNFFKLRDLGDALGFEVDFNAVSNAAVVRSK